MQWSRQIQALCLVMGFAACSANDAPTAPDYDVVVGDSVAQADLILATGPLPLPFPVPAPTGINSAAMGIWVPGHADNCSAAVHDAYRTVGPDGKWYPTWHPPTDPCRGS